MTALLLEADSTTQTIAQGVPTMKGRALIGFGNSLASHGSVSGTPGMQSVGWNDETVPNGEFSAVGFQYQYPHFEQSGSGMETGPDFLAYLASQVGVFTQNIGVSAYGCGELGIVNHFLPSSELEGLLLLSGKTLQTKSGYTTFGGTGAHAVAGIGFQPDLILFSYVGHNYFGDPPVSFGDVSVLSFGAADGTNQWAACATSAGYLVGGSRRSRFSSSNVVIDANSNPVSLTSLDADGFTLNYAGANPNIIQYIAIYDPDGQFAVGSGAEGDASVAPGFKPDAVVFGNSGTTAADSNQAGCSIGIGACDNQLNQYAGWAAASSADVRHNGRYWNTSAIPMCKHPGAVPVLDAEASVTSFNATTVDLNWTTGGAGGMLFGWVAIRTSTGPGFDGCGGFLGQIYRYDSP